jgi:hypothetical protein
MCYPRARLAALAALTLVVGTTACASSSGGGARQRQSDVVTAEELDKYPNDNMYVVLQRIRPHWLQSRATYTGIGRQEISVVLDGMVQQDPFEFLQGFRAGDAREVRLMNARDATTLYGTGMSAGAIVIYSRRGR